MQRPGGTTRFVRYGLVGVLTNLLGYGLFLGLHYAGMPPVMAASLCYVVGVAMSYLLNRSWTFASNGSHAQDMTRFAQSYGIGFVVTFVSMWMLVKVMRPEIAQIISVGITAIAIYSSLRILRFGEAH